MADFTRAKPGAKLERPVLGPDAVRKHPLEGLQARGAAWAVAAAAITNSESLRLGPRSVRSLTRTVTAAAASLPDLTSLNLPARLTGGSQ